MPEIEPDSAETCHLLHQIQQGDGEALNELLKRHRLAMVEFVRARLDPQLAPRFDPSDVVQEAQLVLARRLDDFLHRRPMPFHVWARKTAYESLLNLRSHHHRVSLRGISREIAMPERPLAANEPSPSEHLQAQELAAQLASAVQQLPAVDREILFMRNTEDLSFDEIGCLLEIEPSAARQRFGRALLRLRKYLSERGLLE